MTSKPGKNDSCFFKNLFFCVAISLFGCAGQYAPPGGAVDTTPPEILSTVPEQNTLGFQGNSVILKFSEYVHQRSVQEAVFFSPNLGSLDYEWDGTEVEIIFSEKLRENTTYVLSVGTDVNDRRNGNRMAEAYSLAFSTGDKIDSCSISGRVFDSKPSGVTIFAYKLENIDADTLNPQNIKPDYITQTGSDGSFIMPFLAIGKYRVFAIRDEYKNFLYDPQLDQYGIFSDSISLSADISHFSGLSFRMTTEDTLSPFIDAISVVDENKINIHFNEPIDTSNIQNISISIFDTIKTDSLKIKEICFLGSERKQLSLITSDQDTSFYRLTISGVKDTAGNIILDKNNQLVFQGSNIPDTVCPYVSFLNIKDSVNNIPYSFIIKLDFTEPIMREKIQRGFNVLDTNKVFVEGKFNWLSDAIVSFSPSEKLQSMMWYTVSIVMDSISDYSGNSIKDSTLIRKFRTIDKKKLGEIRGLISDNPKDILDNDVVIEINKLNTVTKFSKIIESKKSGNYAFEDLEEGQYIIGAFADEKKNGSFDYGKIYPYMRSEKFIFYPDTIKVRARWPVDGINLKIKN
jgi:hypothetical protein